MVQLGADGHRNRFGNRSGEKRHCQLFRRYRTIAAGVALIAIGFVVQGWSQQAVTVDG